MTLSGGPNSFLVSNAAKTPCSIHFEPWGTEYVLAPEDHLVVRTVGLLTGNVEIAHVADGIIVAFTDDSMFTVTNKSGEIVPI
jgi:hypothetical protein